MSEYELLSLLISLLAAFIAAYSVFRGQRTSQRLEELQKKQADLASFQHKILIKEERAKAKADIRAQLLRSGNSYKLTVSNLGTCAARDLRISGLEGDDINQILAGWDSSTVFPVPELRPNEDVSLRALVHLGTKLPFTCIFTWNDDSGVDRQREIKVNT
jgi:hypothetical protein